MFGFNPLKSRIARTILYLGTIGGLFFILALAVLSLWNFIFSPLINNGKINIMESAGIVSLFYIIFFSFKFAMYHEPAPKKIVRSKSFSASEEDLVNIRLNYAFKQMSRRKQRDLNNSISKCCGNNSFEYEFYLRRKDYIKYQN